MVSSRTLRTAARLAVPTALALAVCALPARAQAAPLDLFQLYGLIEYVNCTEACPEPLDIDRYQCLADCGRVDPAWEKNQVPPIDRIDLTLALAELEDQGAQDVVCYRDAAQTIVIPGPFCAGELCESLADCSVEECSREICDALPCPQPSRPLRCPDEVCDANLVRDAASCADEDGDGLPAWLENERGSSDTDPVVVGPELGTAGDACGTDTPCNFHHECSADLATGGSCQQRACGVDCTVFHLEKVAEDDRQVLVHVFFDYAPLPVRILDLRINYDRNVLTLEDARPLPLLDSLGHNLSVTHNSQGTLRLVMLDPASNAELQPGALVELVFQRIGDSPGEVSFDLNDRTQSGAMAPLQGNADLQNLLSDDDLWGTGVQIADRAEVPRKLLLWYGFETPESPQDYANVQSADELCSRLSDCANEPDAELKGKTTARLQALQAGQLLGGASIEGVSRDAVYLDGSNDHMRLPVHYNEPLEPAGQSFSTSLWFYSEGNSPNELVATPQLIFTHNDRNERTRFGLLLDPDSVSGGMDLKFFKGDILDRSSTEEVVVAEDVALRTWHHVGFALDADVGKLFLYYDGAEVATYSFGLSPPAISCPGFADGADIFLQEEGDLLEGRPPESIWFSESVSGLFRIKRMDELGITSSDVITSGEFSMRDPDYSPVVNRILFSANLSGNFEIWIAHGDGSNRQQVTVDFGDTSRSIFARRPRWAPDGSGFIFESNVYDVTAEHNADGRGYQLYYAGFDAETGEVSIDLEGGGTATQLEYLARIADDTIGAHQLTTGDGNSMNAWFLTGTDSGTGERGDIVYDSSDERLEGHTVQRLTIPENIRAASPGAIAGLGDAGTEQTLLTAFRGVTQGVETERILYQLGEITYDGSNQFAVAAVQDGDDYVVTVTHTPTGYDAANCWDSNRNQVGDPEENLSDPDGSDAGDQVDEADCYPPEVRNLFIRFDSDNFTPDTSITDAGGSSEGADVSTVGKSLELQRVDTSVGAFVRVEIRSPLNALPIKGNAELAIIRFSGPIGGAVPAVAFAAVERNSNTSLFIQELTGGGQPQAFGLGDQLDSVQTATFSPDGDRFLFGGVKNARPVLFTTTDCCLDPNALNCGTITNACSTEGGDRLVVNPALVRGLTWVREQRFYPCNWLGAYLHPQSKGLIYGLRGGLDDLKVHSGVRDPDSFLSEAARGIERLVKEGRDGPRDSLLPACGSSHTECPPFHLCVASQCTMVECDPNDFYACADTGGRCTLRPPSVEREVENAGDFEWVCAAECEGDNSCFTQRCLNGPCRFCDSDTSTCIECRETILDFDTFQIATIEGCPDANSFACEAGSCVTECYSFDDGQSLYLCDPTLEYCSQGRCVLLEWGWEDFAPISFGGLTETVYENLPDLRRSTAIGELTRIEIKAYGVEDYLHSPELLVEGKLIGTSSSLYGGDWFRIGRVLVHHRDQQAADANPLVLNSPHPITHIRVRLITPPYENLNAGATGLGSADEEFCEDDFLNGFGGDSGELEANCKRRPAGSRFHLGYRVGIPDHEAEADCREKGLAGCGPEVDHQAFVYGGQPAVIVNEVKVGGTTRTIETNKICSYEGGTQPDTPGTGAPKKVVFGDILQERSNQQSDFCSRNPDQCGSSTTLANFTESYGLLNCNFRDPSDPNEIAAIEYASVPVRQPTGSGLVTETANNCFVEVDAARIELCYEWTGGDVNIDPMGDPISFFNTLEFSLPRSYGHSDDFTSIPLPEYNVVASVSGYDSNTTSDLVLGQGDDLEPVTADGDVTFQTQVKDGRKYSVFVASQPLPATQACAVNNASGNISGGDATVNVVCGALQQIEVAVSGLGNTLLDDAGSVKLTLNGGSQLTVSQDGTHTFETRLPEGANYAVAVSQQPLLPQALCTFSNSDESTSGTVASGTVSLALTCELETPHLLSGTAAGVATGGTVTLQNIDNGDEVVLGDADGTFTFGNALLPRDTYDVRVTDAPVGQTCIVSNGTGVMPNADVTNLSLICVDDPTYSVSVTVATLTGSGLTLLLNGDTSNALTADSNATFTFSNELLDGESYEVTVQNQPSNPAQTCEVVLGTGVIRSADVADVQVFCGNVVDESGFTLGGSISGLNGTGLVLSNKGAEELSISSDGSFEFPGRRATGTTYNVRVLVHPTAPTQLCTVSGGRGTIGSNDVTSIQVNCVSAATLTVTVSGTSFEDAGVVGALYTTATRAIKVAETLGDAALDDGAGAFSFHVPSDGSGQDGGVQPLTTGTYTLVFSINENDSEDNVGNPTIEVGEATRRVNITVSSGTDRNFTITGDAGFSESKRRKVHVSGVPDDSDVVCYWSLTQLQSPLRLPPRSTSSVVGISSITCGSDDCTSSVSSVNGISMTTHAGLAPGNYVLTCWVDTTDDDALNADDYFGQFPIVSVNNNGDVAQLVTMTQLQ